VTLQCLHYFFLKRGLLFSTHVHPVGTRDIVMSKGVEWPAKRCYVGLVDVGVQEQAEDILVPPLLRHRWTLNDISFS